MQLRTPLSLTKGLGAAKDGVGHWTMQRLTGIANVLLVIWFLISAIGLAGADYEATRAWLASPFSASMMLLLGRICILSRQTRFAGRHRRLCPS